MPTPDVPDLFGGTQTGPGKTAPVEGVQRVIGTWVRLFQARFQTTERPVVTPRDGAAVKRLVLQVGPAVVERRLAKYFEVDDEYLRSQGYPLALLPQAWNRLMVAEREGEGTRRVPGADATRSYLRSMKGGLA